ncbi:hypothetical protein QSU92_11955 [Microbacterium sp. ET2]|uniref:hypothetical protein n=1 Tax=Microbacterium albipurpureum TaxID=3050384 RepID=UPI00259CE644|nr:hypothetical protein [Microbacterium sp. ET2 (Ac-2212)]WJL94679.1 hypothetical protein QSU92_11955 [Microbacterium sp. ET2 (Ac-2212)]
MTSSSVIRRPRRLGLALLAGIGAAVLALGGSAAAQASGTPEVTTAESSIAVGETTVVTATGLGGLEQAFFGLGDTSAAVFTENNDSVYEAPVSNGEATATLSALTEGTNTISVGDGENVLATVEITVTAGGDGGGVAITANPTSIDTGESTTVTATGLGGLEEASFGLGGTGSGSFDGGGTSAQVPVTNGEATTTFTATEAGDLVIAVGDGETPLASVDVAITAAPTPTPTPTPTTASPTAAPEPAGDSSGLLIGIIIALVVLILAIVVTWIVLSRRSRQAGAGSGTSGPGGDSMRMDGT